MKNLAVLILSCVAVCSAIPEIAPYEPPKIEEEFDLKPGKYRFNLRPLLDDGCWYLRFRVKSSNTIFIQFSTKDEDGSDESYEVMIGAWNNKNTCIRKGRGDDFILDERTKGIITGRKWQEFYIKYSKGVWEIGHEDSGKVIATAQDDNTFDIKYVGVKSEERSWWKFDLPGFGRRVIRQDIHKPGEYVWAFPELYERNFYFEFAVKSGRDAIIVFSPSNYYEDDIYEIIIGAENNIFSCLRRKKKDKPIIDIPSLDILHEKKFRYFWVEYKSGTLKFGRWGVKEPIIEFTDENPLRIKYFGLTSIKNKSWWRLYMPCAEPLYICEHESYDLKCPDGRISIRSALYGRSNAAYCYRKGLIKKTDCGDPEHSFEVLRRECAGKKECTINAKNSIFKDPCRGTFKYLQFEYSCCKCD
ncbi:L-rhamnose-binding lectin ELEL-1 [Holothuria leucospilota]|uniref:L-rhamnose-binding lectin ELEL-1 n=1 Tax=Holothuria leucospilota TaxID=206669 RepID=A0A9Q0YFM9_HOLLE|nr:L-rhamnose-binding lectin ELEL-1 [Holothuria leucospilota]